MKNLIDIKYWIFDLDNTLYSVVKQKFFQKLIKKCLLSFQKNLMWI